MRSKTNARFRLLLGRLPTHIQQQAIARYHRWRVDPFTPVMQFKEVRPTVWSVRINDGYRALARRDGDLFAWFWIGTHGEYDRLLRII